MSGGHRGRWQAIYAALLSGQLPDHRETFSCPSPTLRRKYELTVRPISAPSGPVEYLEHRTHLLSTSPALTELQEQAAPPSDESTSRADPQRMTVNAFSRPLEGVGGDLVWSHRESETRGWFLIADAMGHDERAAAAADCLRDLLAEDLTGTPNSLIESANKKFLLAHADDDDPMFVTGILFRIDLDAFEARICVFGHHGFLTTNNGIVEIAGGLPVGLLMDAPPWPEHILDTRSLGTRTMAFTDGLFEQFNPQGEMYTIERIAEKFFQTKDIPLSDSIHQIIQSIDDFRDGAGVKDDQSILGTELAV